jgi:hypothetical protein
MASSPYRRLQRRGMSGVELGADALGNALLNKAEQFGFDVVAGELDRELLGALTVARLREDPLGQRGLASWRGQSADVLHLRVGVRVLEAVNARVQIEIGQCGHGFEDGTWKRGITKTARAARADGMTCARLL